MMFPAKKSTKAAKRRVAQTHLSPQIVYFYFTRRALVESLHIFKTEGTTISFWMCFFFLNSNLPLATIMMDLSLKVWQKASEVNVLLRHLVLCKPLPQFPVFRSIRGVSHLSEPRGATNEVETKGKWLKAECVSPLINIQCFIKRKTTFFTQRSVSRGSSELSFCVYINFSVNLELGWFVTWPVWS